jgi:hypothetical protein
MRTLAAALQSVCVTLWVGGLWTIGFVVAPTLFARVPDRVLAGLIAGRLFTLIAWIGVACAVYLLAYRIARAGAACLKQGFFWVVLLMLGLTLAGELGVQPVLENLRLQALPREVMESVFRDRFAAWHGVASALYVIVSLLGLALAVLHGRGR